MNKIYTFMEKNILLQIIKNSFISIMPFTIVSSFFVLILNFPVPAFTEYMQTNFTVLWLDILPAIPNSFNNLISLFLLISVSFNYSILRNEDSILYVLNTMFAYFIFLPSSIPELLVQSFGASGIFFSMICSLFSCYILTICSKYKKKISFHSSVPEEVGRSFEYLLPLLFSAFIFFFIKMFLIVIGIANPAMFINEIIQSPITKLGSTLPAILIINTGIVFLWFFGFNGSYIFNSIMNPIYFSLNMDNLASIASGNARPHIITGTFQSLFINFGGSGSTIALIIALLLFSKNVQRKSLSKLAFIPGLFNINEPIIYGLPVILNFKILFPFICCPIVNTLISYWTMNVGIVEKTNGIQIPWTTPPVISGFLSSGISGALLQFFLIVLNVCMYFPFIRNEKGLAN